MQDGKGEAVANYREPFPTQQMGYPRLSQRVNKIEKKRPSSYFTWGQFINQLTRFK